LSERRSRFGCIDGIRGFLALSVFFHHFIITYYWKVSGSWQRPPEDLFQNLGKVGVAIFFMITGFLFFSRIVNQDQKISWLKLYKSRVFRIYPLYLFVLTLISLVVFYNSDFVLNTSFSSVVKDYVRWGLFLGGTINDFSETKQIIAGVDWTLKYEWLFYLSLPLLYLAYKVLEWGLIATALLTVVLFLYPISIPFISSSFFIYFTAGAMISQFAKKVENLVEKRHSMVSAFSVLIIAVVLIYPNSLDLIHILLMSVLFLFIAAGNNMFKSFSSKASIVLGEISYSIYLTHGIVLYILFSGENGKEIALLSIEKYALLMPLVSVVVVLFSSLTFLLIEKPGIDLGKKLRLFNS
jgi:peptidoglycan/LPS O-acetylase OafA/YrhL